MSIAVTVCSALFVIRQQGVALEMIEKMLERQRQDAEKMLERQREDSNKLAEILQKVLNRLPRSRGSTGDSPPSSIMQNDSVNSVSV